MTQGSYVVNAGDVDAMRALVALADAREALQAAITPTNVEEMRKAIRDRVALEHEFDAEALKRVGVTDAARARWLMLSLDVLAHVIVGDISPASLSLSATVVGEKLARALLDTPRGQ